ncbi:10671_t:CDS:1, partial [Paraglomus brasilianum]
PAKLSFNTSYAFQCLVLYDNELLPSTKPFKFSSDGGTILSSSVILTELSAL